MRNQLYLSALLVTAPWAGASWAQETPAGATPAARQIITLNASTPALCKLGVGNPLSAAITGDMSETSGTRIGRLRTNINAMTIDVPGWCNGPSTLTVSAQPMLGPTFTDGERTAVFSRAVNFRARALGWTPIATAPETLTNATRTGSVLTPSGISARVIPLPTEEIISISLDTFTAASDGLLVQGNYSGTVTITLGAN
jgi:hypothetical protein